MSAAYEVNLLKKCSVSILVLLSILMWVIVFERCSAAIWAWYKFSAPYGGGGQITVGIVSQLGFYALSVLLAATSFRLSHEPGSWGRVALYTFRAVVVLVMVWSLILISPLASFRPIVMHRP